MLKLFEVTGFKNFRHTVSLDFSDVRDYKFHTDCVSNGLLNKVIVYGKNAAGKSNFGLALFDIVSHLTTNNVTPGVYDYYLNVDNDNGYAEFHYVFQFQPHSVDYRYRKNENQDLIYEEVWVDRKLLFRYDHIQQTGDIEGIRALAPTLNLTFRGKDSLLKYLITNSALQEGHPLYQLLDYVSHMLWFRSLEDKRYIGYKTKSNDYPDFLFRQEGLLEEFEAFLHQAGIEEKLIGKEGAVGEMRLYFDTKTPMPFFKVASSGTKALYTFFYWYKTTHDVSLMVIDEFDAFYHYELAETIVKLLAGKPNFQTILTSHNTNLLSNRIMRPDCYFILSKSGLTSFANATKRELREGHNLEKLYMSGEFDE